MKIVYLLLDAYHMKMNLLKIMSCQLNGKIGERYGWIQNIKIIPMLPDHTTLSI